MPSPEPTFTQLGALEPFTIPFIPPPAPASSSILDNVLTQAGVVEAVPFLDVATANMDDISQVSFFEPENVAVMGDVVQPTLDRLASLDSSLEDTALATGTFTDPYIVQPVSVQTPALLDTYNMESQNNWSIGAFLAALVGSYLLYKWWK